MKNITKLVKSFQCAIAGIMVAFHQRNMRIHGLATILVVVAGICWKISLWEWVVVLILVGLVLATELINSSFEELSDLVRDHNRLDYQATRTVRDMAAGAVLIVSIVAAIIGLLIFLPKIFA